MTTPAVTTTATGQEPGSQENELSATDAKRIIAELRKEAAANRTKLNAFEKKQQEEEAARLSETEKATKRAEAAEAKLAEKEAAHRDRLTNAEIKLAAKELGVIDVDAAAKLLDRSQLEFDDDGNPTNAAKLLTALAKERPWLVSKTSPTAGGATNPPRSGNHGQLTHETINKMTRDEYLARRPEIQAFYRTNPNTH